MNCLLVCAHPLGDSLCSTLARTAASALEAAGHVVEVEDLYRARFSPVLSEAERRAAYVPLFDSAAIDGYAERLLGAEAIVWVFPTWWFGFPAILKGWFDRVWAPGVAYDEADGLGPVAPRLHQLRRALAVTPMAVPWWVDRWVVRQPVKRVLKAGVLRACAPECRFEMLPLYEAERVTAPRVQAFCAEVEKTLRRWR